MPIQPFKLERYFAKYEFSTRYLLSSSDCDGLRQEELLDWADPDCRELWKNLSLGYTESQGHPLLREEIAKLYKDIQSANVLTVVPEEGIFIAMQSILRKGDHIICTFPGYQSLCEIARSLNCEVTLWEPEEENGWRFDPEFLKENIRKNTRLIVINFPHNPTGYLPSQEDYKEILEIAQKHGSFVFSDEMYRMLELDPAERLPSACEVYDKAVSLFGMSKTFGLAGLRQGWLTTQDGGLFDRLVEWKDYTTICGSAPSEILSIIGLRKKDIIIKRHMERIQRNLSLIDDFMQKHADLFSWTRPRAGTIGFPRLYTKKGAAVFCAKLVEQAGIMLLPSSVYDYDDAHVRFGFGRENFPEGLNKLRQVLKKSFT